MKINEFIKEVNRFAAVKVDGDCIYIAETQDELVTCDWFLMFCPKQQIMSKS